MSRETSKLSKGRAIAALRDVLADLDGCKGAMSAEGPRFKAWKDAARATLRDVFGPETDELFGFDRIVFSAPVLVPGCYAGDAFGDYEHPQAPQDSRPYFLAGVEQARELINAYARNIDRLWEDEPAYANTQPAAVDVVVRICDRFHVAARRMRTRREQRQPLVMDDEYDVQYLLGAILDIHFDDIEREGPVPGHAGAGSRIDFVLRRERIAIEVKRTRPSLTAGKTGEALLVDIARYEQRDTVDTLIFFVYDPESLIDNSPGLVHDIESRPSRLKIRVLVRPK